MGERLPGLNAEDTAAAYATAIRILKDDAHKAIHGEVYGLALAHVLLVDELRDRRAADARKPAFAGLRA